MSIYNFGLYCYKPLVWCGHKHTFFEVHVWPTRAQFSVINTLLSTRMGGPLREERIMDGWPPQRGAGTSVWPTRAQFSV